MVIEKIQASGSKAQKAAEPAAPKTAAKPAPAAKKAAPKKAAPKKAAPKAAAKDFAGMTVAQLKEEAKAKGIEGISSMKKADLIAALSK